MTSTLLTLIAIPTFYEILDIVRSRFGRLARRVLGNAAIDQVITAVTGEHRVGP
jgi:hypothetical protein